MSSQEPSAEIEKDSGHAYLKSGAGAPISEAEAEWFAQRQSDEGIPTARILPTDSDAATP